MGKRMYYIFKIIQKTKMQTISAKDILNELIAYDIYIDIKTVYEDIKRINEFFYEMINGEIIVAVRRQGYTIQKEFFSDGEIQFLFDSLSFHEDLKKEDKENLKKKLMLLSSYHQEKRIVNYIPKDKDISFSLFLNLTTIMKAIENKKSLEFEYITYEAVDGHIKEVSSENGNHGTQYIMSPYQIVSSHNHYYVIGYNKKYKDELTIYRIDRMRQVQTLREAYVDIREQFDMNDEIDKTTNMYLTTQRITLQLQCEKRVLREVISHFGLNVNAQKLLTQDYLITIDDIPMSEGLIGWIMMLQDSIKIIAPISLQTEIKKRIDKMVSLYQDMI